MLKKELLVIGIIFLISAVSGFQAEIESQETPATPENPVALDIQIENTAEETKTYRPDLVNNRYEFLYIPSRTLTVPTGEQGTLTLTATPGQDVLSGNYEYNLKVEETETSESKTITDYIRVSREDDLQLVRTSTDSDIYTPGQNIELETEIKNYGTRSYQNYNITAELFNQTKTQEGLDITRDSERRYTHEFSTTNKTEKGEHSIRIKLEETDGERKLGEKTIEIDEQPVIETQTETTNRLISATESKKITNNGNAPGNYTIETNLNPFLAPITQFNHEPVQTENNGSQQTVYEHQFYIEPSQEQTLDKTVQYWKPATALVILVGLLVTISKLREDVTFQKEAKANGDHIKIRLEIQNNSNQPIENLVIKDSVPNIAKVKEDFPMAKPKIRKKNEGTELTWTIDELEPSGQRIIEYQIKPVVEVEEGATLKPAEIKRDNQTVQKTDEIETEFKPK